MFDILDDDENNEQLDKIMREYNQDFDFDYIYTNVDEEAMITNDDGQVIAILSLHDRINFTFLPIA